MKYKTLTASSLDRRDEPNEKHWGINHQINKYAADGWLLLGSIRPYEETIGAHKGIKFVATMYHED